MRKNLKRLSKYYLLFSLLFFLPLSHVLAAKGTDPEQQKQGTAEPLYLNLVWNLNAGASQDGLQISLKSPEIRHATVGHYFALAQLLKAHPNLHTTINISAETLKGIKRYTDAIGEFVDLRSDQFDYNGFLKKYGGKTDPWLDLLLVPSASLTDEALDYMLNNSGNRSWHCFSVSPEVLKRFPEYQDLMPSDMQIGKIRGKHIRNLISVRDRIKIKFFFAASHFDDMFLRSQVDIPLKDYSGNPVNVNLNDYFVVYDNNTPDDDRDDQFVLTRPIGEDDCQRMVLEIYKVMQSVLIMYQQLAAQEVPETLVTKPKSQEIKQVAKAEFITTPASNAVIPLLYDTDVAKEWLDKSSVPLRFSYPEDASLQMQRALQKMKTVFGVVPKGICPTDGFVSEVSNKIYSDLNIEWVLSGKEVLAKSMGKTNSAELKSSEVTALYKTPGELKMAFAETDLTKDLNALYPSRTAEENAAAFFELVERYALSKGGLLTLVIDVDRQLDFYQKDYRGRKFLKVLLDRLDVAQGSASETTRSRRPVAASQVSRIVSCTPSEYIHGVVQKNIPPHEQTTSLPKLATGGFETTNFRKWIGNDEQKLAWTYLSLVRGDLKKMGIQLFSVDASLPKDAKSSRYFEYLAWESIFAAENSIWFEHYQNLTQKQSWQDEAFRTHLRNVYVALEKAGRSVETRKFLPIFIPQSRKVLADFDTTMIKIDGVLQEDAWFEKAGIWINDASDSQGKSFPVRRCYYGMDDNNLFLALDAGSENLAKLSQDSLHRIRIVLNYEQDRTTVIDFGAEKTKERGVKIAVRDNIAELQIPFRVLDNFDTGPAIIGAIFTQEKVYDRTMGLAIRIEVGEEPSYRSLPDKGYHTLVENVSGLIEVVFEVDATRQVHIPQSIYIVGDKEPLGNWKPNQIQLFDNGKSGDKVFNDKIWSRSFKLRLGDKVQYKYTNSGTPGRWDGQEFEKDVRTVIVQPDIGTPERMVVHDIYGVQMQ